MPRSAASRKATRRRIPSSRSLDRALWAWPAVARPGARRLRALLALLPLLVAAAATVALVRHGPDPAPARPDPVEWLETPPPSAPPLRGDAKPKTDRRPAPAKGDAPVVQPPTPAAATATTAAPTEEPLPGGSLAAGPEPVGQETSSTHGGKPEHGGSGPSSGPGTDTLGEVPASAHPVAPRYPARAEARGLEARVVALVATDTLGNVVSIRIERSGGPEFDESVRQALRSTRYTVPVREGRRRPVAFRLPYEFRLD